MFQDIIELLLQKKANLDEEKRLEIEVAIEAIEAKYAEHSATIEQSLSLMGYVEPVEETPEVEAEEPTENSEVCNETVYQNYN